MFLLSRRALFVCHFCDLSWSSVVIGLSFHLVALRALTTTTTTSATTGRQSWLLVSQMFLFALRALSTATSATTGRQSWLQVSEMILFALRALLVCHFYDDL